MAPSLHTPPSSFEIVLPVRDTRTPSPKRSLVQHANSPLRSAVLTPRRGRRGPGRGSLQPDIAFMARDIPTQLPTITPPPSSVLLSPKRGRRGPGRSSGQLEGTITAHQLLAQLSSQLPSLTPIASTSPLPTPTMTFHTSSWTTDSRFTIIPDEELQSPLQTTPSTLQLPPDSIDQLRGKRDHIQQIIDSLDRRHAQRVRDSAEHVWCKPVERETVIAKTKAFYEEMNDDNSLGTGYCRVCFQQQCPAELLDWTWAEVEPLYKAVEGQIPPLDRGHFSCEECFPRHEGAPLIAVCKKCASYLQKASIPPACRVNNFALGCTHRYPAELKNLSPLEERLLGQNIPCGWITKFDIDIEKWTSAKYRKHKRGHITVFPNDVEGLATSVLPHPLVEECRRIHVCFVGPRKPVASDLSFMLSVDPGKLRTALIWLKSNNHLYHSITISEENLASWSDSCAGTQVPAALFAQMVRYDLLAEDEIRTGHYIAAAERGRPDEPVQDVADVLVRLEQRHVDMEALEIEGNNARLGANQRQNRGLEEMQEHEIEVELEELRSTGLLNIDSSNDHSLQERVQILQDATLGLNQRRQRGPKPQDSSTSTSLRTGEQPFIVSRRGEDFADYSDPDFFPKTFPCLFPWGRGGPLVLASNNQGPLETSHGLAPDASQQPPGFYLQAWASHLLRRHGKRCPTLYTVLLLLLE